MSWSFSKDRAVRSDAIVVIAGRSLCTIALYRCRVLATGSRRRRDEIRQVSQRVVEVVRPERREADVLADGGRDR